MWKNGLDRRREEVCVVRGDALGISLRGKSGWWCALKCVVLIAIVLVVVDEVRGAGRIRLGVEAT